MDSDLIRTFVAVADAGGFTKAEAAIRRPQSTISQQIARLEQELGRRLLDRNTREMTLTSHGVEYLNYARQMLILEEQAIEALRLDVVRVGIPEDFWQFNLPALLRSFAAQQRDIRIEMISAPSRDLAQRLKEGQLDIAAIKEDKAPKRALHYWQEELRWVAKEGTRLGAARPVPLVCFPEGCTYRSLAVAALTSSRIPNRVMYESSNWTGVKEMVENGLGITLLSDLRGLSNVHELDDLPQTEPAYLVLRSKQMPPRGAVAAMAETLIKLVPQERAVRVV